MDFLEKVFKLLNDNSKFPKYQLERRVDIFINIFLEDILTKYFNDGSKVKYICPEFPFKKDGNRQSTNVDYLCLKELIDGSQEVIFVELKTNYRSFDDSQLKVYFKNKEWSILYENIIELGKPKKYQALYSTLINSIKNVSSQSKIRIIYISPLTTIDKIISMGYAVHENKAKVTDLLLQTQLYPEVAKLFSMFVNGLDRNYEQDLGVFEIIG
jgi:hypothetical protein